MLWSKSNVPRYMRPPEWRLRVFQVLLPMRRMQANGEKNFVFQKWSFNYLCFPNAPCREYLPTFPLECSHFSPNVGKYSIQGASGFVYRDFLRAGIPWDENLH